MSKWSLNTQIFEIFFLCAHPQHSCASDVYHVLCTCFSSILHRFLWRAQCLFCTLCVHAKFLCFFFFLASLFHLCRLTLRAFTESGKEKTREERERKILIFILLSSFAFFNLRCSSILKCLWISFRKNRPFSDSHDFFFVFFQFHYVSSVRLFSRLRIPRCPFLRRIYPGSFSKGLELLSNLLLVQQIRGRTFQK